MATMLQFDAPAFTLPGKAEAAIQVGMNPAHMDAVLSVLNIADVQTIGGADPSGTVPADAIIASMDATLQQRGGGSLAFSLGRYRIAANLDIRSAVEFEPGAVLVPDNGVTVTFHGSLRAGLTQLVDVSNGGTVAFAPGSTPWSYPEWFGAFAAADTLGDTIPAGVMPAWYASIESDIGVRSAPTGYLNAGVYTYADQIAPTKPQVKIAGRGRYSSFLNYAGPQSVTGVVQAALNWAPALYSNPTFSDFSILSTGRGIDWSRLTPSPDSQVYNGAIERMELFCANQCMLSYSSFSCKMDTVYGESLNDHIFQINNATADPWINVWGQKCPAGKAAFRMAGIFHALGCNGVGAPSGYWGIYGSNPAGTDGFQNDFPGLTSYPDVHLMGCNFEDWAVDAHYCVISYQEFRVSGGEFVRGLGANYQSAIHLLSQALRGPDGYITLDSVRNLIGGGAHATQADLWQEGTNPGVLLLNDSTGWTSIKCTAAGVSYNVATQLVERINNSIFTKFNGFSTTGIKNFRRSVAANYQATELDGWIMCDASGGAFTVTLPLAANCDGLMLGIKKLDASGNAVTLAGTIDGAANPTLAAQYKSVLIVANANTGQWEKFGAI